MTVSMGVAGRVRVRERVLELDGLATGERGAGSVEWVRGRLSWYVEICME